ncbi:MULTISPECIES: hypothetical protein [unclassified Microbacterium]|uniref:hypothetical protein n=1 Tax=unclassified Microbacterium TaxID=2609290 RepID=UPI003017C4F2
MGVAEFLSFGDVVNVVLTEEAFPFVQDPTDSRGTRNGLQGRVIFADTVGLRVYSDGGRCMPLFADDSYKIEESSLTGNGGAFFPWSSVVSVVKVSDSERYEAEWEQHERDQEAFYNAHGSSPASSSEFYRWRNSISQTAYDAAYNTPRTE